jgi:hypothetical protein
MDHPAKTASMSTRKSPGFHPEVTTIEWTSTSRLFKEEANEELWYSSHDLDRFKKEAANLVFLGKHAEGEDNDASGLERYTLCRAKPKIMAIKCVLLAQKQNVGHEFVALVSQACSALATELAFSRGLQDYCQAYDHTFENKRAREQLDLPQEGERRVKQEISPIEEERSSLLVPAV